MAVGADNTDEIPNIKLNVACMVLERSPEILFGKHEAFLWQGRPGGRSTAILKSDVCGCYHHHYFVCQVAGRMTAFLNMILNKTRHIPSC